MPTRDDSNARLNDQQLDAVSGGWPITLWGMVKRYWNRITGR